MAKDKLVFDNFKSMIEKFEERGYRIHKVEDDIAIIFNDGVDEYMRFDMFVIKAAETNDFHYCVQDNLPDLAEKSDGKHAINSDYELYIGVGDYDNYDLFKEKLCKSKYSFMKYD